MKEKLLKWKFKLESKRDFSYNSNITKKLTASQSEALNKVKKSNISLLYWVTWAWKTEIYVNLIKDELEKWGSVLLLVPEIILTSQLQDYIVDVFWNDVIVLNSSVTDATKTKNRIDLFLWKARLVIWTRSAIFYPYKDLSLVIVDEEHDDSYISWESPRYDSVEILEHYSHLLWFNLLLASWTPKASHVHNFLSKWYNFVNLTDEIKKS
jgi:primosomal protein N' (replication factor Y)